MSSILNVFWCCYIFFMAASRCSLSTFRLKCIEANVFYQTRYTRQFYYIFYYYTVYSIHTLFYICFLFFKLDWRILFMCLCACVCVYLSSYSQWTKVPLESIRLWPHVIWASGDHCIAVYEHTYKMFIQQQSCVCNNTIHHSPCSNDWKCCKFTIRHRPCQLLCYTRLKGLSCSLLVWVVMWRLLIQPYVEACSCSTPTVMNFVGNTWFRWSYPGLVIADQRLLKTFEFP